MPSPRPAIHASVPRVERAPARGERQFRLFGAMGKKSRKLTTKTVHGEAGAWRRRIENFVRLGSEAVEAATKLLADLRSFSVDDPPRADPWATTLADAFTDLSRRHEEWKALVSDVRGFEHEMIVVVENGRRFRIHKMMMLKIEEAYNARETSAAAQMVVLTNDRLESKMLEIMHLAVDCIVDNAQGMPGSGFYKLVHNFDRVSKDVLGSENFGLPVLTAFVHSCCCI